MISKIVIAFSSLSGFLYVFYTSVQLMIFLSLQNEQLKESRHKDFPETVWSLLINMLLISLFVLQHSLMALPHFKSIFQRLHLECLSRSVYVIATSWVLNVLINNWQYTPNFTVWNFTSDSFYLQWIYNLTHLFAWSVIYSGCLIMDFPELIGMKQVYYFLKNLPDPEHRRSPELRELYSRMRHPGFLMLTLIFWLYPVMSLDRVLLSTILSGYMYIAWNPNQNDCNYHRQQLSMKDYEFSQTSF